MLKDLTRGDWLRYLKIPEERVPAALVLRGTRNLKSQYRSYQKHFTNVLELGGSTGILEDIFIGDLDGYPVAYASVYGAPMASEVVHVFGVLGTPLVVQTGCCGALGDAMMAGDLFIATEAHCGEGASQYYEPGGKTVTASIDLQAWMTSGQLEEVAHHRGRIYTTSAVLAEGMDDIERWHRAGFSAVDMETAATFAVAQYFNMDRVSILFVFDNPRRKEHLLEGYAEKDERWTAGDTRMVDLALEVVLRMIWVLEKPFRCSRFWCEDNVCLKRLA